MSFTAKWRNPNNKRKSSPTTLRNVGDSQKCLGRERNRNPGLVAETSSDSYSGGRSRRIDVEGKLGHLSKNLPQSYKEKKKKRSRCVVCSRPAF